MREIDTVADELFAKLRGRFGGITLGNNEAKVVSDPAQARFFNFDFSVDDQNFGNVTISLVDDQTIKIIYSTNITNELDETNEKHWFDFLRDMRRFSQRNMLGFEIRDISKSYMDKKDYEFVKNYDGAYSEQDVRINESFSRKYGTKKKSYQKLKDYKIIIDHTVPVDEQRFGARGRNIKHIFIATPDGERYKLKHNYLPGARCHLRHAAMGGHPRDAFGEYIDSMIEDMHDLKRFVKFARRKNFSNQDAKLAKTAAIARYQHIKETLKTISGIRGYKSHILEWKPVNKTETVEVSQDMFTQQVFDESLKDTLPAVENALRIYREQQMEYTPTVAQAIKDPEYKLVLKKDDAADQLVVSGKYRDNNALLQRVLADIASRAIGPKADEVANFASHMAELIASEPTMDPKQVKDPEYRMEKSLASRLAKKYLSDLVRAKKDNDYADEIRKDPTEVYGRKKDRTGREKISMSESFERWANMVCEGTWAFPETDEEINKLRSLMNNPIPVGIDGENAQDLIGNIIGDDTLFDNLYELSKIEGPKSDARDVIFARLRELDSDVADSIAYKDDQVSEDEDNYSMDDYVRALKSHDWTYMMSDDPSVYRRGEASLKRLEQMAKKLDPDHKVWDQYDQYTKAMARFTEEDKTNAPGESASKHGSKVLSTLQDIVDSKQAQTVNFQDGKSKVDLFTASAITKLYDAVNDNNKTKMRDVLSTRAGLMKMAKFAMSKVNEQVELDEAKNYEIKDGKIHISKSNFAEVHKDYKNTTTGKERMMALDPKTGATTSFPVVFTESNIAEDDIEEDNAFNTAAANAALADKKEFEFNGKTYPVKMSKEQAKELVDESKELADILQLSGLK